MAGEKVATETVGEEIREFLAEKFAGERVGLFLNSPARDGDNVPEDPQMRHITTEPDTSGSYSRQPVVRHENPTFDVDDYWGWLDHVFFVTAEGNGLLAVMPIEGAPIHIKPEHEDLAIQLWSDQT